MKDPIYMHTEPCSFSMRSERGRETSCYPGLQRASCATFVKLCPLSKTRLHVKLLLCWQGIVWEASEHEIGKRVPLVWAFFQQASRTCIILCQTTALKEVISKKVKSEHVLLFLSEQIWVDFKFEGCNALMVDASTCRTCCDLIGPIAFK